MLSVISWRQKSVGEVGNRTAMHSPTSLEKKSWSSVLLSLCANPSYLSMSQSIDFASLYLVGMLVPNKDFSGGSYFPGDLWCLGAAGHVWIEVV